MPDQKLFETDYFGDSMTWFKRFGYFLIFSVLILSWEAFDNSSEYWWIKYAILAFITAGLILSPVDDIAVNDKYFYHVRRSRLKSRNKIARYEISKINSIRCLGVHVTGFSLQEMVGTRRHSAKTNSVEISFKDGTYKGLELAIDKNELIFYVQKVRERMETFSEKKIQQ